MGIAIRKTNKKINKTSLLDAYQNPFFVSVAMHLFVPSFTSFIYSLIHLSFSLQW